MAGAGAVAVEAALVVTTPPGAAGAALMAAGAVEFVAVSWVAERITQVAAAVVIKRK
jgi:hypothetical protein